MFKMDNATSQPKASLWIVTVAAFGFVIISVLTVSLDTYGFLHSFHKLYKPNKY